MNWIFQKFLKALVELKSNIAGKLDKFLIKGKKLITKEEVIQPQITQLNDSFKSIFTLFESTVFLGTTPLPSSEFNQLLTTIEKISTTIYDFYLTEDAKLREDKPEHFYNSKYRSIYLPKESRQLFNISYSTLKIPLIKLS